MTRPPATTRLTLSTDASEASGLSVAACDRALRCMLHEIVSAVAAGRSVHLRGLATFYPKMRGVKPVRNPKTGRDGKMLPERLVMLARMKV